MAKGNRFELNAFYCLKCGNKSMELPRQRSMRKERFHRKVLYCPCCKDTLNHVEIRNEEDRFDFLDLFERGVFKDEAEESLSYVRTSCFG